MRAVLKHIYVFTAILMSAGFLCVQVQANEHPENETQQASPASDLRGYHEFDYKFEDRPDPFLPFLNSTKPPGLPEGKKIDPNVVLTGWVRLKVRFFYAARLTPSQYLFQYPSARSTLRASINRAFSVVHHAPAIFRRS